MEMEGYKEHFQYHDGRHQITQHIRYGLMPLPFGTLLPTVATSYMLETLYTIILLDRKISRRTENVIRKS